MKIALAQQNYHVGNFEDNTRKILEGIRQAKQAGASDMVVVRPGALDSAQRPITASAQPAHIVVH